MGAADLFVPLRAWLTREVVVAEQVEVAEVGRDRVLRRGQRGVRVADRPAEPGG